MHSIQYSINLCNAMRNIYFLPLVILLAFLSGLAARNLTPQQAEVFFKNKSKEDVTFTYMAQSVQYGKHNIVYNVDSENYIGYHIYLTYKSKLLFSVTNARMTKQVEYAVGFPKTIRDFFSPRQITLVYQDNELIFEPSKL